MIIKSRFKDYYDFVANLYGGGDPKIVYDRKRLRELEKFGQMSHQIESWVEIEVPSAPFADPARLLWTDQEFSLRVLVVAGKAYLMYKPQAPHFANRSLQGFMVTDPNEVAKKVKLRHSWTMKRWLEETLKWHGKENPAVVELCRLVGAPVFVVETVQRRFAKELKAKGPYRVKIHGQCPILADHGMPALIPPQQMYQDIAYFMGNTIKPSPDTAPPVEVGNEAKILNAGFDLRWSFRHRT